MLHYAISKRNKYKSEATHSSSHRAEANLHRQAPTASGTAWVLVTPPHAMLRTKATGQEPNTLDQTRWGTLITSAFAERWLSKEPSRRGCKGPSTQGSVCMVPSWPLGPGSHQAGWEDHRARRSPWTRLLQAGVAAQHLWGDTRREERHTGTMTKKKKKKKKTCF